MLLYYQGILFLSFVLTVVYGYIWHKRFNTNFTMMFAIIPLANLGFCIQAQAKSLDAALIGTKISYLGGCFETLFMLYSVFSLCKIEVPRAMRGALISFNTLIYMSVLTVGERDIYYKNITYSIIDGVMVIKKEYGFMHSVYLSMIVTFLLLCLAATIYTYISRNDVSRSILNLQFFPGIITALCYFFGRSINDTLNLIPLSYVLSQIVFLLIIQRYNLYDISDTAIDSLINEGATGFISVDRKFRFLGCNETAERFFPQLEKLSVDKPIAGCTKLGDTIIRWIKVFDENEQRNKLLYKTEGRYYLVTITHLYDGAKKRGYQLFLTDDTQNQIAEKAKRIVEMQDKLMLGIATMVESRDNSTGGHIRRTSEGVRMLIDEMKKDNTFELSEEFCRDVIKAAPLHDLGKIAVDDAILRKPGRFTPEEFEKMKSHAAEGARIVREILSDSDDPEFLRIAENVAHYHHERWDGSGYPEGLAGEEIPLEARIMAVADVYDALVSKRVYKEKMSFEQADSIIMEGMGKHFDKRLEPYFVAARPKLEEYYSSLEG